MRNTKNIILGIVGFLISTYSILICLDIYSIQTQKNLLENKLSRAVKNIIENYDSATESEQVLKQLEEDILINEREETIQIDIKNMDLEKGALYVEVIQKVSLITGREKEIKCEKAVILERKIVEHDMVTVTFFLGEEIYKQYQLAKGEVCPVPKSPGDNFQGWIEYGTGKGYIKDEIGAIWEDKIYVAVAG